jgi:hypothetical protein
MESIKLYAVMVDGKQTPTKLYKNITEATEEAKRLAIQTRNTTYVLLAIQKVELNDVKITTLTSDY